MSGTRTLLIAGVITSVTVVITEMGLFVVGGPAAVLIALPLSISFFGLSIWFEQLWHYAATGKRL